MNKKLRGILSAAILVSTISVAKAEDSAYTDRQAFANDKLLNAQAQLQRLQEQEKAIKNLIKAVKKDLKAAKIRAKAERIQSQADVNRADAATLVEQSGLAVDLPDLMLDSGVQARLVDASGDTTTNPDRSELMFQDNSRTKSVFFPGAGIENDSVK